MSKQRKRSELFNNYASLSLFFEESFNRNFFSRSRNLLLSSEFLSYSFNNILENLFVIFLRVEYRRIRGIRTKRKIILQLYILISICNSFRIQSV